MQALRTAATGMMAQEQNVQVISNNVANLRTTGYKRQRAEFQDLLYSNLRRMGTLTSEQGTMVPAGIQIGSGVRLAATPRVFSQGALVATEKQFDIAIRGEGFFRLQMPDGRTAYTRDGTFNLDANGQLVTKDGYVVDQGITIPQNARSVTISGSGQVQITPDNQTTVQTVGQLQLARFVNRAGLESIGDNLFVETPASGQAVLGNPGVDGSGTLLQGYSEEANVNAVTEIADLISAQRAYEMNARVIRSADEMLSNSALTR